MQGHWATLSFHVLELLVKAEGKGRWRSMILAHLCLSPCLDIEILIMKINISAVEIMPTL